MQVHIDPHAGFCFGVEKAIEKAEGNIEHQKGLFCLGEIVHNREETNRLSALGIQVIDMDAFRKLKNTKVLIRAHGEPPETYEIARKNNIELVEATCPVVLKLQQRVRMAWQEIEDTGGTVIIAGKKGHPEVIGLAGQTGYRARIVSIPDELENIDFNKPVRLFSQTTFSRENYNRIRDRVQELIALAGGDESGFKSFNSICGQVSNRIPKLQSFCLEHDVIIFVSGKNSSNGKNLYQVCREANPASYHISNPDELDPAWTGDAGSVGISGATSTPRWLMEKVAEKIARS